MSGGHGTINRNSLCRALPRKGNILFKTVHYTIHSRRIPAGFSGFRIVHLSDLHGHLYGPGNRRLIHKICSVRPDLILMTGDMADRTRDAIPRLIGLCRQLRRRLGPDIPIYYTLGNHEQTLPAPVLAGLIRQLEGAGAILLNNSHCVLTRDGSSLELYGLVTPMVYYRDPLGEYRKGAYFSTKDTIRALGPAKPGSYRLLLAHNPLYYPSYRDWGADLTFSGHIHGGIIRVPGIGGVLSPDLTFFPRYDGGHFQEKGRHLIVSRGLGNHFLLRVFNPPELVTVTLRREA